MAGHDYTFPASNGNDTPLSIEQFKAQFRRLHHVYAHAQTKLDISRLDQIIAIMDGNDRAWDQANARVERLFRVARHIRNKILRLTEPEGGAE